MESKTKLVAPNPKSISLRTSVPREIIKTLDLTPNDEINWIVKAENNNMIVEITKA